MPRPISMRLRPEQLEARETPAAGAIESFDTIAPPALPAGWRQWSSDGSNVFDSRAGIGSSGTVGVASTANSRTQGLAWNSTRVSGDTGAAAAVKLDSIVPTFVFARGSNLNTAAPSYLSATITRGVNLTVTEVVNGTARTLGSVSSPSSAYFSSNWVRVALIPTGNSVAVQVTRLDNAHYLTPQGKWQVAAVNALTVATWLPSTRGFVGLGRGSSYAGTVALDNFEVIAPAPAPSRAVQQNFDSTAAGSRPAGWSGWSTDAGSAFGTNSNRAVSAPNGFLSTGGSTSSARAWADADFPADVQASAAVYLDSLVPAQIFVRGTNLNTAAPTYYAVTLSRGLDAQLIKVVNGVGTSLGSIKSSAYFSSQWLRVSLVAQGDRLRGQVEA